MLLENLRFEPGEEAERSRVRDEPVELGDVYVDDAFGAAHRAHASIVGPPASCCRRPPAGCSPARSRCSAACSTRPKRPFVAVLGGVKVSDKLGVIDALLDTLRHDPHRRRDGVHVPRRARARTVGDSLVEADQIEHCTASCWRPARIEIPTDIVAAADDDRETRTTRHVRADVDPRRAGRASTSGPRPRATTPTSIARARRRCCGTARWACSRWRRSRPARARSREAVADCRGFTVVGGGDSAAAVRAVRPRRSHRPCVHRRRRVARADRARRPARTASAPRGTRRA